MSVKEKREEKKALKLWQEYMLAVISHGDKNRLKKELNLTEDEFQLIRNYQEAGCQTVINNR